MSRIEQMPVIVVVIGMEGCPSCESYIPTFRRVASKYARCVPALVVDANQYPAFADHLRVTSTPTTIVLRHGKVTSRPLVGEADEKAVDRLFHRAMVGLECAL